jgi:hypothetical protein
MEGNGEENDPVERVEFEIAADRKFKEMQRTGGAFSA